MNILITGTSRGIGEAIAAHYIEREHNVIGCGRSEYGLGDYHRLSVSDTDEVSAFCGYVNDTYHYLDVLINNAGVAAMNHFLTTPDSTIEKILNTNLLGTILMSQTFTRLLRLSERGRIVNFTSVAAAWNLPGEAVYAASKAAVESLTRTLAHELAPWKTTVNAVGPGPAATNLIGKVPQDKIDALLKRQAIPRMTEMKDIINVIDFFIRPESDFITGQVIYLGGVS